MKMRIPTNREYDELVRLTDGDDKKMHWKDIFSLTDDKGNEHQELQSVQVVRGFYSARLRECFAPFRNATAGFRPACEPGIDALSPDTKRGNTIVIGTLYMNGKPVKIPQEPTCVGDIADYLPGAKLEMREALDDPTYQVTGIYIGNGIAVADRVLLSQISRNDLK